MRSFGGTLKAQRRKLGLTQKQVAAAVGVSDAYICTLESDKKSPPPYHTVAVIADALELDAESLWKIAAKYREKQAVERSRRKKVIRTKADGTDNDRLQQNNTTVIPDDQINAFFNRPEIRMTTFGLFHKQPQDMTMKEKRAVYRAIARAREAVSGETDGSTDSS